MTDHGELLHIDEPSATRIRAAGLPSSEAERIAGALKGLADPTRLGLAMALRDGRELCVCDLSWIAQRAQNLVSHHMKVLRTEGLVTARKEGKMTMFTLTPAGHALVAVAGELAGRDA
jgi:DNA-binding transcriptional ArsR family regulator